MPKPIDKQILVIIGPSGVGKSSVVEKLIEQGLVLITPSWTSRPKRDGERDYEHVFCSAEEFEYKERSDDFLEVVQLFNLPYKYGLPRVEIPNGNKVPLIMLRAMLIDLLKKHYDNAVIYQIEAGQERAEKVLLQRKSQGDKIGSRAADYNREVELGRKQAKRIFVNDKLESTVNEIIKSIAKDFSASSQKGTTKS